MEGECEMAFRDQTSIVDPDELLIVQRGVEHRPVAPHGEVKLLPIDPDGTPVTYDVATATAAVKL